MERAVRYLRNTVYWAIVLIPFFMAVGPFFVDVLSGFLIAPFIITKALKRERLFKKTAADWPIWCFFAITCLSIIKSVDYSDTLKGGILRLLRFIFVFFVVGGGIEDKKHLRKIIVSVSLGVLLTFLDSLWQIITGHDFIRGYVPVVNLGLARATASFKDSNTLGIYLSAVAPLIFGMAFCYYASKPGKRIAMFFVAATSLITMVLTYSRPTLLAAYVALFLLGLAGKKKILLGILIALILIGPFLLPPSVKEWAREVEYNPLRFMCNDDRIAIYRHSINMIRHNPVLGVGANTFMKNYKRYKEFPEYRNVVTIDYIYAHNNFLHMAAEIGLVGLGIFVWFLYTIFKEGIGICRNLNDTYLKIFSLSTLICLIAFLVNGLTESSLYYSRVAVLFWYLAGLLISFGKFVSLKPSKR